MGYVITKDFAFEAAHRLTKVPEGHQCARLHGHSYLVRIEATCDLLDEQGMVFDYALLGGFKDWLAQQFDHQYLNEVVPVEPTAENLAKLLFNIARYSGVLPESVRGLVTRVGVSETSNTWAWYGRS